MLIGHQPKDFLLAVEGLTVSFDRLQGGSTTCHFTSMDKRDPRHHRPQRRRQDHGARSDLRPDQGHVGIDSFSDKDLTKMKENQIVQAGVGRKFQTPSIYDDLNSVREPRDFLSARPHGVRRADLYARRHRARPRSMKSPR